MDKPDLHPGLKDLILQNLDVPYQSTSCLNEIPTDNHYQSLTLGSEITPGFRTIRSETLDKIRFTGKKVLDLGSNLGEMSRAARDRGAALVDGFEYDPYFVQVSNAVNAYNGTTRVSFYERDITDPLIYTERYDIVLAFSVYVYVRPILAYVAGITDEVLVMETHSLEDNLHNYYIDPVLAFLPHHRLIGWSEWGTKDLEAGKRAIVAFARSEAVLSAVLTDTTGNEPDENEAVLGCST